MKQDSLISLFIEHFCTALLAIYLFEVFNPSQFHNHFDKVSFQQKCMADKDCWADKTWFVTAHYRIRLFDSKRK